MLIIVMILVFFVNLTLNQEINNRLNKSTVEQRLHKDLLEDYQSYQPPTKNVTTVYISFILKYFYFDSHEEGFHVYTWTCLSWNDPRLTWKPEDYENIIETQLQSIFIWRPDSSFENVNNLNDDAAETVRSSGSCQVKSDGNVLCLLRQSHSSTCITNITNWPYDIQFCSFKFVSQRYEPFKNRRHRIKYSFAWRNGLLTQTLSYGAGWNIVKTNSGILEANDTTIQFDFLVERQALGFATIVVIPSIVMGIFTLSSLFLDVRCNVRIVVQCLSLINHFTLLEIISVFIPHQDSGTPLILRFIAASMFVTVCAIIFSISLKLLLKRTALLSTAKVIIFNEWIFNSPFTNFIFPKWEVLVSKENEHSRNITEMWTNFASTINSLFLYTLLFVYLILYCVFIPRSTKT